MYSIKICGYTIAIICALTLESEAVEEFYYRLNVFYSKQPGDDSVYANRKIGNYNVLVCYMPGIGIVALVSVVALMSAIRTLIWSSGAKF
ncbi:hypothetical protein BJX63DRAFT_416720, partial [Aspergillus granulosus]